MSAKPERDTQSLIEPLGDDADRLRSLVSAMLSGTYPEDVWLRDVTSQCQAKPEFGRNLLALIERYNRLGEMPATQYSRVRQKIEASMATQVRAECRDDHRAADAAGAGKSARRPLPTEATVTAPLPIESAKARPASARTRASAPPRAAAAPDAPASPHKSTAAAGATGTPSTAAAAAPVEPSAPPLPPREPFLTVPPPRPRQPDAPARAGARASPAKTDLVIQPGTVLRERYELESLLGCGGMATVYKALDRYRASLGLSDCHVALKIVTPNSATSADDAPLGREFHNAQQLSHPNIVNVFEIDHEAGATFYTMELLEGEQLDEVLGRIGGPLPFAQALAVVRDIGAAIGHAHSRGILHADLKPQNVFVTFGGQVRVLDFGGLSVPLAGPWIDEPALTPAPERYRTATPAYASCEQLEGQQVDPRDDIYSLACISYELLTGRHPFDGHSALQARAQHLRARRPPQLTTSSWRALKRALSFRRAQRPRDIGPWLEQLGVAAAAVRLPPSYELRAPLVRSHWARWVALAASLMLCVGAALALVREDSGRPDWNGLLASARSSLQQARDTVQERLGGVSSPDDRSRVPPGVADTRALPAAPAAAAPQSSNRSLESGHHHRVPPALLASAAPRGSTPATPAGTAGTAGTARSAQAASAAPPPSAAAEAAPASSSDAPAPTDPAAVRIQSVEFSSATYEVNDTSPAARVVVRRNGSNQDELRFVWWTQDDTAKADVDYAPLGRRTEHMLPGQNYVTLYVPIISNPLRHETATFYVALGRPGATEDSPSARASVTIERGG